MDVWKEETKQSLAVKAVEKSLGKKRFATLSPTKKNHLVFSEMERRRKKAEKKFLSKLHTLRNNLENTKTRRLDKTF